MKSLIILFILSFSLHSNAVGTFDVGKYIEKCGGKIYPSCDSDELNQLTIYKEVEKLAINSNKKILLILGADWCSGCNVLNGVLKSNPEAVAEIEKQFLIVELSGDRRKINSSSDLADYLGILSYGVPLIFKIDPSTKEKSSVFISSFNIDEIKERILEVRADEDLLNEVKSITHIGEIPLLAFDVPIDLSENFGQYPYFKSKKDWFSSSESEADKYINGGIARFNLFHYIDAARCFKQALNIEPDNAMAKSFLAMAYLHVSPTLEARKLSNVLLSEVETNFMSKKERVWFNFAKSFVYSTVGKLVQDPYSLSLEKALSNLQEQLQNDTEVLTLATYLTAGVVSPGNVSPDNFEKALELMPNNAAAHHYLVHHHENSLAYYFAEQSAIKLTQLAPDSAHAQHMLGHIAPRLKKWKLAEEQFLKAAKIHLEWADKYNFPESYDWHYSHNLDLMGSVYVGLKQEEKAMDLFISSCSYDFRACLAALKLGAYTGSTAGLDKLISTYGREVLNRKYGNKKVFAFIVAETYLEEFLNDPKPKREESFNLLVSIPDKDLQGVDLLLKRVLKSYLSESPLDISISDHITLYAKNRLGCASFDGWGKGMLDLLRLMKFAKTLGFPEVENDINKLLDEGLGIEFNYSS